MAIDSAAGGVDALLPLVTTPVGDMDVDGNRLYVVAGLPDWRVVSVDAVNGPRSVLSLQGNGGLAVRNGRLYADVERDLATGTPTGNPFVWTAAASSGSGVFSAAGWHGDISPAAPQSPVGVSATVRGGQVTLRWLPAPGDFAPFTPAPVGGTAAMSHVVSASLMPGGPVVATFDTNSPDTTWSIAAPPGDYWLRVAARNQFGTSAPSGEVAVQVLPAPPGPPTATRVVVSGRVVHLEWQPPAGGWAATNYLLDAGTAPGLSNIGTLPMSGTTFDAPVPPGRYYVRIRAVNANGASVPGDEVIIDVP